MRCATAGRRALIVWPGVSSTSRSTVLPTLITSPAGPGSTGDRVFRIPVREDGGTGALDHGGIPTRVVAVLVRIQDLRDRETRILGSLEAFLVVERIDRERFAGFRAGNKVVEVAVAVGGPDLERVPRGSPRRPARVDHRYRSSHPHAAPDGRRAPSGTDATSSRTRTPAPAGTAKDWRPAGSR